MHGNDARTICCSCTSKVVSTATMTTPPKDVVLSGLPTDSTCWSVLFSLVSIV